MKKKQYKVKYENGEIKPLEPLDMENNQEGIVIFEDRSENKNITDFNKVTAFKSIVGILSDIPNEKKVIFEDSLIRKPWRNE